MQLISVSTNGQVCANHDSVMQKGVLNGMFVLHQFLFYKKTCIPQRTLRIFSQIMLPSAYCQFWNLLLCLGIVWGGRMGGLGRPYIKFKLCPFAIYSCVMENGLFMLYLIFYQFGINLLDMPHQIWRKILQIMQPYAYCQ